MNRMDPGVKETHPLSEGELLLAVVETIRDPFLILEADLKVRFANESFLQTFQVTRQETDGRRRLGIGSRRPRDVEQLLALLVAKAA